LLAFSGIDNGALLAVLTLLGLGLAWIANISVREVYLTLRNLTWFFIAIIISPLYPWLLFEFTYMDAIQHIFRRLGACYVVLCPTDNCRAFFNGVDKNHF
jgi:hypothetical protein